MDLSESLDGFLDLATHMADVARPIALKYHRRQIPIDIKADASPVTIADKKIESVLRALIAKAYPDHGILGEEHGVLNPKAKWLWVIDPIDGTQGFVIGGQHFGTLIALLHEGIPVIGIIEAPACGDRWVGVKGRATLLNGVPVKTRPCPKIADSWLAATSPHMFVGEDLAAFERLRASVRQVRYGTDCYAYGLLASGLVDVVAEADLKPYDYCALVPVVEGAGGNITDWDGAPLTANSGGRVLAAGDQAAHAQALALLKGKAQAGPRQIPQ